MIEHRRLSDADVKLVRALNAEREALLARAEQLANEREECLLQARAITVGKIAEKFEVHRATVHTLLTGVPRRRRA